MCHSGNAKRMREAERGERAVVRGKRSTDYNEWHDHCPMPFLPGCKASEGH